MTKIKVRVEVEGAEELKALVQKIGALAAQATADATSAGAKVALDAAKQRAPGPFLEMTPGKMDLHRAEFEVGPDKAHWYYQFFETGVGTHEIDGIVKKALAFSVGAEDVVVARAKHPGMAAEPFLRPAVEENQAEIQTAMGVEFRKAIERAVGSL